jgi:hypothetical protein
LELWLADDRDGEVVDFGLSDDELRTRTTELADSAAERIRDLVRGFLAQRGSSAMPEFVSKRVIDAGMPEPVSSASSRAP